MDVAKSEDRLVRGRSSGLVGWCCLLGCLGCSSLSFLVSDKSMGSPNLSSSETLSSSEDDESRSEARKVMRKRLIMLLCPFVKRPHINKVPICTSILTVHKYFHEVLVAMMNFSKEVIVPPTFDDIPNGIQNQQLRQIFKGALGVIDGTLINACISVEKQVPFRVVGEGNALKMSWQFVSSI
ncbi:hypothetical protein QYF36_007872 [Acer negundo]|nr:hypothetical protein QYF36_007872 [Acer negundo]